MTLPQPIVKTLRTILPPAGLYIVYAVITAYLEHDVSEGAIFGVLGAGVLLGIEKYLRNAGMKDWLAMLTNYRDNKKK